MCSKPHHRFVVAAIVSGVVLMCLFSCGRATPAVTTTNSTSVTEMLKAMPNLNVFDVDSVDFTITRSTAPARGVPSPSDTRLELSGTVDLSADAAEKLKNSFDWKAARRANIPAKMLPILPPGDYLISAKLNDSFTQNTTYAHGYVVVINGNLGRLYVLASDRNHPIE